MNTSTNKYIFWRSYNTNLEIIGITGDPSINAPFDMKDKYCGFFPELSSEVAQWLIDDNLPLEQRELIKKIIIKNPISPKKLASFFRGFKNLEKIENLNYLSSENAISLNHMFKDCCNITTLDISSLLTDELVERNKSFCLLNTFENCQNLRRILFDPNKWTYKNYGNTDNVNSVFYNCRSLLNYDKFYNKNNKSDAGVYFYKTLKNGLIKFGMIEPKKFYEISENSFRILYNWSKEEEFSEKYSIDKIGYSKSPYLITLHPFQDKRILFIVPKRDNTNIEDILL